MALVQVSTADLEVGMYVAQLDRPWLETPFLFQGFTIKSEQEIGELARYCGHVFVDGARSQGTRTAGQAAQSPAGPAPGSFYQNSASVEGEAPRAKSIHHEAAQAYAEIVHTLRGGGKFDIGTLDAVVTPMIESVLRNQDALVWLSRIRHADAYTYDHSVLCSVYAIALGRHLGLPKEDLQVLGLGALLFDVGKTQLPRELLDKAEPLTTTERAAIRRHVEYGLQIVQAGRGIDARVISMVRSHHERYDGSGYPDGLTGPDIPVFARIAGIVDLYCAMTSARPYASPRSSYDAMRELHRRSRGEFQPELVDNFVQAIGMFPNGALVELSSGEVGVVVEQNRVRRLRPKVLVILDEDKKPCPALRAVDLRDLPSEPGTRGAVWIERGLEPGAFGIDAADYFL